MDGKFNLRRLFRHVHKDQPMLPLADVVHEFLEAKALALSPHTIRDYKLTLERSCEFWGAGRGFQSITTRDVRAFLTTIPGSRKNQLNAYIALSSLWTWAIREEIIETHIVRRVDAPKPRQTLIRPFSKAEILELLAESGRLSTRNRAIILFLLDTGVRASELCGIRLEDVDLDGRFVRVLGKGNKERDVPVSQETWQALLDYYGDRPGIGHADYLFTTQQGNPMKRDGLLKLVQRIGHRAGVKKTHPHRFRHTFAVNYLTNGGDPFTLQRILGHSTIAMVNRYLNLAREDLRQVHQKASPVKNWKL